MARLVRLHAPGREIVLGGHGAAIEGVEELIDCDHVVRGEGIRWLRRYLGQDPDAPIVHPVLPSTERKSILGVPAARRLRQSPGARASAASTAAASAHLALLRQDLHAVPRARAASSSRRACRIADERGTDDFFVMDENFLKDTGRARELLAEMERAAALLPASRSSPPPRRSRAFGVDEPGPARRQLRLDRRRVQEPGGNFAKNAGVDPRGSSRELRDHGISVLASGILCLEHHTPENIQEDIDFMVELEADFIQFMLLTPLPVTALYQEYKAQGLLRRRPPVRGVARPEGAQLAPPALPRRRGRALALGGLPAGLRGQLQLHVPGHRDRPAGLPARSPAWRTATPASRSASNRPASEPGSGRTSCPSLPATAVNERERARGQRWSSACRAALGPPTLASGHAAGGPPLRRALAAAGAARRRRHPAAHPASPATPRTEALRPGERRAAAPSPSSHRPCGRSASARRRRPRGTGAAAPTGTLAQVNPPPRETESLPGTFGRPCPQCRGIQ